MVGDGSDGNGSLDSEPIFYYLSSTTMPIPDKTFE